MKTNTTPQKTGTFLRQKMVKNMQKFFHHNQNPTRVQNIEAIPLEEGGTKYRVTGRRTGQENNHDIIDRSIPLISKFHVKSSQVTQKLIYWCFTCSFWKFFIAAVIAFVIFNALFALFILALVLRAPDCLSPSLEKFDFNEQFNDALHLSWTTFSTVGYGLISPSTAGSSAYIDDPGAFEDDGRCLLVSFLLSFESLIGVLFVGFCSAIIFGKVTLFQSDAKVCFSNIIIISYGKKEGPDDDLVSLDSKEDGEKLRLEPQCAPRSCPTLRFRIANELHSRRRGEIIDAKINAVATIEAKNCILGATSGQKVFSNALTASSKKESYATSNPFGVIQKGLRVSEVVRTNAIQNVKQLSSGISNIVFSHKQAKKLRGLSQYRQSTSQYFSPETLANAATPAFQSDTTESSFNDREFEEKMMGELTHDIMVQDETELDKANLVFSKIVFEPSYHPFFKSTWNVSHSLNSSSPFLTKSARKKLMKHGGNWPEEMYTEEEIRKSIHFDNLLISFKGQSKVTGGQVYSQKLYTLNELKVGFEFKSLLMKNPDNSLFVRVDDVDKVRKQRLS